MLRHLEGAESVHFAAPLCHKELGEVVHADKDAYHTGHMNVEITTRHLPASSPRMSCLHRTGVHANYLI